MKKLHYLAGRHCGLCKLLAPSVTALCQKHSVTFCLYYELPVMPEKVRNTILAANVDKLPIIVIEADDGQVSVFQRDEDGKMDLRKLEDMIK